MGCASGKPSSKKDKELWKPNSPESEAIDHHRSEHSRRSDESHQAG
jgi:hypothetical protein